MYPRQQVVQQLEARKGGYFYFEIPAAFVETLTRQRKTRLICTLDQHLTYPCGLNHLGNGDYFIILSKSNLKQLNKDLGSLVELSLVEDPNPLGVEIPEVLQVLLEQDTLLKRKFEALTDGKKRGVIHQINRIKNMDLQISRAQKLILEMA